MNATVNELAAIVDRFSEMRIGIVGDVILDHYIWGEVSRISPEAPVVVVHVSKEEHSLGGAANVAKNVVALGAGASVVGAIGNDDHGKTLRGLLEESGVSTSSLAVLDDRSTTVKSRVLARAQQVVRVDRESSDPFPLNAQQNLAESIAKEIESSSGIIVSDYAKGVVTGKTYEPLSQAFDSGVFSVTRPLVVDPKNANFDLYNGATVVKPNRIEAESASGLSIKSQQDAIVAARELLPKWRSDSVLVTLGELGMVSVTGDSDPKPVSVPTRAKEVYDVSGAGDTVAAVYCLALCAGASSYQAAELSNIAAGVVVAEIGAVAITTEQLHDAIVRIKGES